MRYTLRQMQQTFPTDEVCLHFIFRARYRNLAACPKCGVEQPKFYKVTGRTAYACKDCGHHLYPLVGTIFAHSSTPLTLWFHAIYLLSVSKNGVSAKELERQLGTSYKTSHRMAKMIRLLMEERGRLGRHGFPVEIDEAYMKGKGKHHNYHDNSTPVLAAVEVGGQVRTQVVERATADTAVPFIAATVYKGAMVHTDESKIYQDKRVRQYVRHRSVRHIWHEYVKDGVTTNHIEGFFGQLKRSVDGTFHAVSPYYLRWYVSEFAYRYNHRREVIFPLLLEKAAKPR
jgi:transposase